MKTVKCLVAVLAVSGATVFPGVGNAQTLDKVAQSNKITVAYREAAVPFSYALSPTRAVGFSVDITDAIVDAVRTQLKKPGLEVTRRPVTGQNRIPLLLDGTIDLECGSTTNTAARGKDVAFAISHFYTGTRVLVAKNANVRGYAELAGKPVASVAGSTNEKVLRKYSDEHGLNIQLLAAKDYGDGLQMLEDGRVVGLALDDVLLFGLRANSKDPGALAVVGETLQVEPYGCMLRKDDPAFKKLVDGTIARLMKSGEFNRLYVKWFESPIPPNGAVLAMPMSPQLKANLKALSDKPAN